MVVGSGISGTLAAAALGRAGCSVCLIDRHAVYPPDFRAEHLDGPQIEQLRRLGFLSDLTAGLYRGETVTLARSGRLVGSATTINYGLRYETLVARARSMLPANVRLVTGRVAAVEISDDLQHVTLAGGQVLTGRLVILATGQGYTLCKQIGATRRMLREGHSLTFGFNIERADTAPFQHSFIVYQRERIRDRMDYLAAFTLGEATRVNLFTYRDYRDPWTKAFLQDPNAGLADVMPGLGKVLGPCRAIGPVVARPTDLYTTEGHNRGGAVLIGDAFQSSCPATGMGMVKLLTDVEQLCTLHLPRWLATPGMNAGKIAQFYADPLKKACDAKALHDSEYRRAISTETSLSWQLHRLRVGATERLKVWQNRLESTHHPRVAKPQPESFMPPGFADGSLR